MKKIIAIILALLALTALTVTAFAAADAADAAEPAETSARASREAKPELEAAVSEEDALAAALTDAGLAEADVTVTRTRLHEKENEAGETVVMYTVKFHTEDTTYKYQVDANTGMVIDSTVTEGVSEGRSRGEASDEPGGKASGEPSGEMGKTGRRGGKASGEMGEGDRGMKASGEMEADGLSEASTRGSGRSGGRRGASGKPEIAEVLVDAVTA